MSPKPRACRILSLFLGIVSVILSYWMLGFFALATGTICLTDYTRHTGQSWRSFAFVITRYDQIGIPIGCLVLATMLGGLGLRLVRAEPRRGHSVSASALRLCFGGLLGAALDAIVISGLLAYRWLV